jgi:hypothetical protein
MVAVMRTTILFKSFGIGVATAIWTLSIDLGSISAQQDFPEFSTYQLFPVADSAEPNAGELRRIANVIRNAQPPGSCPLGRLKIRTPEGDPMFQAALAGARQQAALQGLNNLGVPVVGRLFVESTVFGQFGGHDTVFEAPRDTKSPKLTTTSVPRKGSKVKAGDQITVTMVARDDPAPWPTGLRTIQLVADSENGRFVMSENYEPCAEPAERRVVATYTVPQNPPAIVRLTAIAEDHARHMDTDVGEFPTGEMWKGTVNLERDDINPACSSITSTATYTIVVVQDGRITGDGTFDHSGYTCQGGYTAAGTRGRLTMSGAKENDTLIVYVSDWEPKNAQIPRLPGGRQIVHVGNSRYGEATFSPDPAMKVVFRVKLECQTCDQP